LPACLSPSLLGKHISNTLATHWQHPSVNTLATR
jgi:hypothetical protein